MDLTWRRLAKHEIDYELVWLLVSAGSLAAASIWFALGLPWPICVFHELTGLPCLTCGATRCAIAFAHGNVSIAWAWNPLVFVVLCGVALFDLYALAALAMRTRRLRILISSQTAKTRIRFFVVGGLLLNWVYLLGHYRMFAA